MPHRVHSLRRCWIVLVAGLACSQPKPAATQRSLTLRAIDTSSTASSWDWLDDSLDIYRVEVRAAGRVDTLTDIIEPMPFPVGDDSVAGLRLVQKDKNEGERRLFVFSLANRKTQTWPLPNDVWSHYYDVAISPDARYVAYVGMDTSGTYPIVRELSSGRVVMRGPGGGGCECDTDRNDARWLSADSVEIAVAHHLGVHLGHDPVWLRLAGQLSTKGVHLDTLKSAPTWH